MSGFNTLFEQIHVKYMIHLLVTTLKYYSNVFLPFIKIIKMNMYLVYDVLKYK